MAAQRFRVFPRVFVGLVLLATGFGKALDMAGFVTVIEAYRLFSHPVSVVLAHSLPLVELSSGFLLISGLRVRLGANIAVGLHLLLIGTVVITLGRGIQVDNCGCFGVFWARPLGVTTLIEDAVMLAMSIWARINAA